MRSIFTNRPRRNRGITFAELMLVLVIAGILTLFFVLSSRALVTRTKVSRVLEEHRMISRALQNYQLDFSDFPARDQGMRPLTASSNYMTRLPSDPFQTNRASYVYLRLKLDQNTAVIISPGPDGDIDLPPALMAYASLVHASDRIKNQVSTVSRASRASTDHGEDVLRTILEDYLANNQYDPEKGDDGDVVTVVN